jgi:hypothetical protein
MSASEHEITLLRAGSAAAFAKFPSQIVPVYCLKIIGHLEFLGTGMPMTATA